MSVTEGEGKRQRGGVRQNYVAELLILLVLSFIYLSVIHLSVIWLSVYRFIYCIICFI